VKLNVPLVVGLPVRTPEALNDSHEGAPLIDQVVEHDETGESGNCHYLQFMNIV
jgi:hypothetical protein